MNKKLPLISLFIMSIVSIFYWAFKSKDEFYEAKWNAPDTTLAITINGEISTTFPTTNAYTTSVECTTGTGSVEWNDSKWILTTSGITKGSTKCNAIFKQTLRQSILANNEVKAPLTTPGSEVSSENEALLASTGDDYGTSYYFRGTVKNNYVQFANKCWRIVRITGDGSVKLVLHNDNTGHSSNPCASSDNSATAAFAKYSGNTYLTNFNQNGDNAYIGFMYGTIGASNYASAQANKNKSEILTNLETWYKNNLMPYESKLADTIWCNDKSTLVGQEIGYGTKTTNYAIYQRMSLSKNPTLICPNDNDGGKLSKFTVNDTVNGNGDLTYKIGLLTADEILFSGSIYQTYNTSTYLQENTGTTTWWTLSPESFIAGYSSVVSIGSGYLASSVVLGNYGLRPAISLVSSTTISGGSGTSEDPYVVN